MEYRSTLVRLTQLWQERTPDGRREFHALLATAERERGAGPRSARGHLAGGGSLEHLVWGGFFQTLADTEFQNDATVEEIEAYVTHRRPSTGRAYICYDLRPDMGEGQRAVWEGAAAFLDALRDREYLERAERNELDAWRRRLVASWQALPLAMAWEQRSVCDEILRQVFDFLICQMNFPGRRYEIWARGPHRLVMDTAVHNHADLLPFVPWGRRVLGAFAGTDHAQLAWHYEDGHIDFSLI